jgi:hypothetical protein
VRGSAVLALALLVVACGGSGQAPSVEVVNGVDLVVDREALALSLDPSLDPAFAGGPDDVVDVTPAAVNFEPDDCALHPDENLVGGPGVRRLVRFATVIWNVGDRDLRIGAPATPVSPWSTADFHFSPCHGHVHFTADWVVYRVLDLGGALVGAGHKQGFCIEDVYDASGAVVRGEPGRYGCDFMGISAGHGDVYARDIPGQWVDVTDLAPGEYVLEVEVNPSKDPRFFEPVAWTSDNAARVRIRLP